MRLRHFGITFLTVLLAGSAFSRRHSRKAASPLQDWQKQFLERIQVAARDSGLPESEVKSITKYDKDVCYEKPCLESALEVMQASNFTVNPCQPYMWYNYVCARRVNSVDNINQVERLMGTVTRDTLEILEKGLVNGKGDDYLLKEAQVYFHQCRNKAKHDKEDVKYIVDFLSENYGKWPMLTNKEPGPNFNWFDMLADINRVQRTGSEPIILKVDVKGLVQLHPGKTTTQISVSDFQTMLTRIQKYLGKERPFRIEQLRDMVQLFNSISASATPKSGDYSMELKIKEIQKRSDESFKKQRMESDKINWLKFFQRAMNGSDIQITPETKINIMFGPVMRIVQAVESYASHSGDNPISNILNFHMASVLLQETTALLDDLNSFKCSEEAGSRGQICYMRTVDTFGFPLGKTYLSVHYNDKVETPVVTTMMSNIQEGYINAIQSYDWMENSTKEFLVDKIQSMRLYVAEAPLTQDRKKLKKFYSGLKASKNFNSSYPENYLTITAWATEKKRSWTHRLAEMDASGKLDEFSIYDMEWNHFAGTVNAQYHKMSNEARILGGIIQPPLFAANRPGFMNYGGLGTVLGHEVGHSFDTQGRRFNKHGRMGEFWDEKSIQKYNEWVTSIHEDYGKEVHQTSETSAETIDASQTLNEDISDIIGIHMSYLSYQKYLEELENEGKHEKILPGLKQITPQKLFFMKYANTWCDKKDVQSRFNDMFSDHSPGNIRATMPLKRSRQFAEAFDCPVPDNSK